MIRNIGLCCLVSCWSTLVSAKHVVVLDKGAFQLTYDCDTRAALRYSYTLGADHGNARRPSDYQLDPDLPPGCEGQWNTQAYGGVHKGFDRGHLVTSNHMDQDDSTIASANLMSNIVPQASSFNQGIWQEAEYITECYRDIAPVEVLGGLIYNDSSNDYFLRSHGIPTPDYFWKVLLTKNPRTEERQALAIYIPNRNDVDDLVSYIVSIAELEELIGEEVLSNGALDVARLKQQKPQTAWQVPSDCQGG